MARSSDARALARDLAIEAGTRLAAAHHALAPGTGSERVVVSAAREPVAPNGIISLLTDFGVKDPFVGVMKAVILGRHPLARVIDLCHGIAPQDVTEGAFWLEKSYEWFPPGTIHVAVVDPGVGSERKAIAARVGGHYLIGPDNGLLSGALRRAHAEAREIELSRVQMSAASRTFHGRDVFAPVAGDLAAGRVAFEALGPRCHAPVLNSRPDVLVSSDHLLAHVVTIDHYGNLITALPGERLNGWLPGRVRVREHECPIRETYSDVSDAQLVALVNSWSTLEIALRNGNAAEYLGVSRGEPVCVLRGSVEARA